jgi:hypothetical protein
MGGGSGEVGGGEASSAKGGVPALGVSVYDSISEL